MLATQTLDRLAAPLALLLALAISGCGETGEGVAAATFDTAADSLSRAGITADDFHTGVLDTLLWDVVDPQGDGTVELVGAGTTDAQLLLSVPAGTTHDAWTNNTALRVMQPAADEDFEIEVKFESEPTQQYQGQGLLVEQDPANYVRFDVYSNGNSLQVFSAAFTNGSARIHASGGIAASPTTYLRMRRSGDQWTARYSFDGTTWTTAANFSHVMTVSSVGVFASNFSPNPAYTAVVDYLFDTGSPIDPEDAPPCDPTDSLLLSTQATNGTILRSPDQSSYACGDSVTLTAQPAIGATFLGWGGALSGTVNPTVLTINSDTTVTASFQLDATPPQLSNINATPSQNSSVVSWQTDELSVGFVEYGLTPSYELGSVSSNALSTSHAVTLASLLAGQTYHFRITSEDSVGNDVVSSDTTFTTTNSGGGTGGTGGGPVPGAILSDDFHTGVLDTLLWDVVDPQGDGTVELVGAGTTDAQLLLSVPAGTTHDAWTNNTALRVMQPAADEDFEIEVKFESEPTQQYQGQGLLVEQDPANYVRFDVYSNGNSLQVFSAAFTNGSARIHASGGIAASPTTYLRMRRSGDQWTARYSFDGTTWTTAANFSHVMTVSSVGVFASNFSPNPAYTAVVDYLFDTGSPIDPEDAPPCDPTDSLLLSTQATNGTILRSPDQSSYACGDSVTLTAQPAIGATFLGWGGALSGTVNPTVLTINSDTTVTASFQLDATPPQLSNINATPSQNSSVVSWQTDELSVGFVEYGLTPSYELGSVSSNALSTSHAVTLASLLAGQTYHFRITSEDSVGNSVTGADAVFSTATSICVLTSQATNGTILRSPDQSSYACGDSVTLTAQPAIGATFLGWGGALSGTVNPTVLTINSDTTVTASFQLDATPPQLSNINATPSQNSSVVSWQTDELSVGFVEYGLTPSYELGSVSSNALSTSHAVTLASLLAGQTYHFRITSEDSVGNDVVSSDTTFTTTNSGGGTGGTGGGPVPGAILSDDFHTGVLDTLLWDVVDPQGDGTVELVGAGTTDAQLLLSVPAGTTHDAWTNNTALRVMQPAADEDFEIEVKFESEPTQQYQGQGLLVEQDPANYVRFDVYSNGNSLQVFSAAFTNGSARIHASGGIAASPTTYLRMRRSGDQWTARYSFDGTTWTTAANFSHVMTVSSVGVFASNFSPNPAYTAVVDYLFDTGLPIDPEDAPPCDPVDEFTLARTSVGPGLVVLDPDQISYTCGEVVTLTAQPDVGAAFLGWGGALSGTVNPTVLTINSDATVAANFGFDSSPPQLSNISAAVAGGSATISWQTDELSIGFVEYGLTPSYELGSVSSSTPSTTHSTIVPGLVEGEIYHYRVTAEDTVGNSVTGADVTFAATTGGPVIDVWYGDLQSFGALGNPQRWINVLGQVADPDGVIGLTYSLNGAPSQNLSMGPFRRLQEQGDFNVEIDYQQLISGSNTIEITAVDGSGFETTRLISVDYSAGNAWPLDYQVNWSATSAISDVAQVVDGRWRIANGELRNDVQGYDRLVAIGDLAWTDYEVTVSVSVHGISSEGFGGVNGFPGVGVFLKWTGHFDWNGAQPTYGYYPIGGGGWIQFEADGTGALRLEDFTPGGIYQVDPFSRIFEADGTKYIWKVRVESQPDGSALYRMRVWADGSPEPTTWEFSRTDAGDVTGGSLLLIAHFADVSFGDIVISPL